MKGKSLRLSQVADLVAGELVGDADITVHDVADIETAAAGELAFIANSKRAGLIDDTAASAVIVPTGVDKAAKPIIRVKDPYLAVALVHNYFLEQPFSAAGVSPMAKIGADCGIPREVSVGPMAVLGDGVKLGKRITIHPGVVIGDDVEIGNDTVLHANVTIGVGCRVGSRVIIHSGTVIGSDGFGYATDGKGRHVKRPQVGIVQIDDDVEIGANVCVDRATFGKTWIQRGTKIDNLVQVAHNVVVGEDSLLVAQSGIAGSTTLGRGVILSGQSAVNGHITLGDRVVVTAKTGVTNSQPGGAVVSGMPAIPHRIWKRASIVFFRLPEVNRELRGLRKKVAELCRILQPSDSQEKK